MRRTLLAMAEGKFAYEQDELIISDNRLELVCKPDGIIEGKFIIESNLGADIKGILYSTDYRMKCKQMQFAGKRIELSYSFNAEGLTDKTTLRGDIYIETNIGEYNLPYVVTVLNEPVASSLGSIRNLFHFTNLAHTDYEQAYKLFVSKKFRNLNMEQSDRMFYDMLVKTNPCREHMEEFLIAVHKKKEVTIRLEEELFETDYNGEEFSKNIKIKKSGWGYIKIEVSSDSDFVKLPKSVIGMEDFIGNELNYSVIIDNNKLHAGNNYARIKFKTALQEEYFEITVRCKNDVHDDNGKYIKEIKSRLCQLYIQVRTHSIHNLSWIRESRNLVESLMSLIPDSKFLMLFHAQLLILDKKKEDAEFILAKLRKEKYIKRQEPEIYAYLLYVEALSRQQEEFTVKAVSEVRMLLENHPHSAKIFWALSFLDDELHNNPAKKYRMLNEQFVYGCHSPFLYLETYLLLKSDPSLMTGMYAFEKQVLSFVLHQGLITEELAIHAAKVSVACKDYDVLLCRLLKNFYNLYKNDSIVEAICSQLIKGGFRDADSFVWYELGVKADLKLNLLYENYLYTVPMDKDELLPKQLLLYYAYNQNVDYRHKAYLYANVTKHKEEIQGIYEKYEPYISRFVEEQLSKHRVTEQLLYLYELHMDSLVEKEECLDILEEIIFTNVITCSKEKMRSVVIGYEELNRYEEFPITDKKAYVKIYTDDAFVAIKDMSGKLHFETVDFEIKPLLTRTKITKYANRLPKKSTGILINRYKKSGVVLEKEGISICHNLLRKEEVTGICKEILLGRLIDIFERKYDEEMIVNLLDKLDFATMNPTKRGSYIEKMIIYGMYDEAYDLIFKYGFENINSKRLVRLCSRKISSGCDEDRLVALCGYVFFSGKYDEVMLNYLVSEYYGSTTEMIKLWTAAKNFALDSYKICERLLIQMLYTGYMPGKTFEIFEDYCQHGPKPEVMMAYVSYLSYNYVVNRQIVEDKFFAYILKLYSKKENLNICAMLAYLKYCSRKNKLNKEETEFVKYAITKLERKEIRFSFFRKVERMAGIVSDMYTKTAIEFVADPKTKITLNYRIVGDESNPAEYIKEEMKPMLGPVYSKELTLFYGEIIQYYITETKKSGEEYIIHSAIVEKDAEQPDGLDGCFDWVNEMYISRSMKDEVSLMDFMKKYNDNKLIADKLFTLKE